MARCFPAMAWCISAGVFGRVRVGRGCRKCNPEVSRGSTRHHVRSKLASESSRSKGPSSSASSPSSPPDASPVILPCLALDLCSLLKKRPLLRAAAVFSSQSASSSLSALSLSLTCEERGVGGIAVSNYPYRVYFMSPTVLQQKVAGLINDLGLQTLLPKPQLSRLDRLPGPCLTA